MSDLDADLPKMQLALDQARARHKELCKRFNFKDPAWRATYEETDSIVLDLERQIAALKGEEFAIPLDFPEAWDVGAPLPHLLTNDHKAFLLFLSQDNRSELGRNHMPRRRSGQSGRGVIGIG